MPWPASAATPGDFARDEEDDGSRAAAYAMATVHPSAVLRADDRDEAFAGLVADLKVAAGALARLTPGGPQPALSWSRSAARQGDGSPPERVRVRHPTARRSLYS